eukprot:scpid92274/ scgid21594/ 
MIKQVHDIYQRLFLFAVLIVGAHAACSSLGGTPAQDGTVLKGQRNAYTFTWILPTYSITQCNVRIWGFQLYHSSTTNCDFIVSVWNRDTPPGLKTNEYVLEYVEPKVTMPAVSTPTLFSYNYTVGNRRLMPYSRTVYIGITTQQTGCRVLGSSTITAFFARYAVGEDMLPGVTNKHNFKRKVTIDLSLRMIFKDIDECAATPSLCTNYTNNVCSNTFGSYSCVCKSGYSGTGGASGTCTYIPTTVPTTTPTTTPTTPTTTP